MSVHVSLELAAGGVAPGAPVPGCGCPSCLTLAAGGTREDAQLAEELVVFLADAAPDERVQVAEDVRAEREARGLAWRLPAPSLLALLAARVPGAVRVGRSRANTVKERRRREWERMVEDARRVQVTEAAAILGLERHPKRDDLAVCPFHKDEHPSLHLNDAKGRAFCNPCGRSWDAIALVMEYRRVEFADAVTELVGGRSRDTRRPGKSPPGARGAASLPSDRSR